VYNKNSKHTTLQNLEALFETEEPNSENKKSNLSNMEKRFNNIFKKDR
jgi:hypothetical protein